MRHVVLSIQGPSSCEPMLFLAHSILAIQRGLIIGVEMQSGQSDLQRPIYIVGMSSFISIRIPKAM